jgi:hypothetical protein
VPQDEEKSIFRYARRRELFVSKFSALRRLRTQPINGWRQIRPKMGKGSPPPRFASFFRARREFIGHLRKQGNNPSNRLIDIGVKSASGRLSNSSYPSHGTFSWQAPKADKNQSIGDLLMECAILPNDDHRS